MIAYRRQAIGWLCSIPMLHAYRRAMAAHLTPLTLLTTAGAALGLIAFWSTHGGDTARVRELNTCADLQSKIDALSQQVTEDPSGTRSLLREHLEHELKRRLDQLDAHRRAQSRPAWRIALTRVAAALLILWCLILGLTGWFVLAPTGTIEVPGEPFSQTQTSTFIALCMFAVIPTLLGVIAVAGAGLWRQRSRYAAVIRPVLRRPWTSPKRAADRPTQAERSTREVR